MDLFGTRFDPIRIPVKLCWSRSHIVHTITHKRHALQATQLGILPETYLALSSIQLLKIFIFEWISGAFCLLFQALQWDLFTLAFLWASAYRLFRKPPDRVLCFNNTFLVERQGRQWHKFVLFLCWCLIFGMSKWTMANTTQAEDLGRDFHVSEQEVGDLIDRIESNRNKDINAMMAAKFAKGPRDIGTWDSDSVPIVVDTATSKTITPRFADLIDPEPFKTSLKGIGQGAITHKGRVCWSVIDDNGNSVELFDDEAYYSPSAPYRLLCPHSWKKCQDERRHAMGETEGDQANLLMLDDNSGYALTWNRRRF